MSDTASFGYGQQEPNDSSSDFNKIAFLVRQMMARMSTMKLVIVKAVTPAEGDGDAKIAGTVDVLPLVNQIDGGGNSTPNGTVFGIPWSRVQGGKNAIICDPEVDDIGYVVVSDRDISAVKSTRKQANPGSFRKFDLADGIYVGGALNVAPDQYLVFKSDGVRLVDKNGNSVAMTPDGMTLTDKNENVVQMASGGVSITPKAGQPVTINGDLVVTGNQRTAGDQRVEGDQVVEGAGTVQGNLTAEIDLLVASNFKLGGLLQAHDGTTYAHDIDTTGDVVGGLGTGDQVTLRHHTHPYFRPTGGQGPDSTSPPNPGT